jgi:hypothetical protein
MVIAMYEGKIHSFVQTDKQIQFQAPILLPYTQFHTNPHLLIGLLCLLLPLNC